MTTQVKEPDAVAAPEAAATTPTAQKMVLIVSTGSLEAAWASLILATTGAASGMDVTIFYTFWGLGILKKPHAGVSGSDWRQKMLGVFNRGSTDHLGLSKLNFAGMGPAMMKGLAKKYHVAPVEELLQIAIDLDVKLWPCQMTMEMMGLSREDLIDGLPEPAGAATAINLMKDSAVTLFI